MMNKLVKAAVFVILAGCAVFGQQRDASSNTPTDVVEIERLEDEWNRINEVSDVEGKRRLLADDSYHVGPSGRLYNKAQDIEATRLAYQEKQATGSELKFTITNRRIRLNGDIAVVTMTGKAVTKREGIERQGNAFRAVHVWARRNGRWQITVDQVTGVSN